MTRASQWKTGSRAALENSTSKCQSLIPMWKFEYLLILFLNYYLIESLLSSLDDCAHEKEGHLGLSIGQRWTSWTNPLLKSNHEHHRKHLCLPNFRFVLSTHWKTNRLRLLIRLKVVISVEQHEGYHLVSSCDPSLFITPLIKKKWLMLWKLLCISL